MKKTQIFVSAFLAGILIGIAGLIEVLLRETAPVAAALAFGAALLAITVLNLHLYTAKAGYLFWDGATVGKRAVHLLVALVGNAVGACALGEALRYVFPERVFAEEAVAERFSADLVGVIISSLICGIVMYVAVHGYLRARNAAVGCAVMFGAAAAIVICGFEHSITDLFFVTFTRQLAFRGLTVAGIAALGNLCGAVLFELLYEYKKSDSEVRREREAAENAESEASHRRRHHSHHSSDDETN